MPLPDAARSSRSARPRWASTRRRPPALIGEIASTLVSDAHQLEHGRPAAELIDLDPLALEGELRGHPWIVASKGRVGFSADDLRALRARGAAAGRRALAGGRGRGHARARQRRGGSEVGIDADGETIVPVHPWQWTNRIQPLFAGDIARGRIRLLGELGGRWLPQQSIRTLADADHPERHHLKLALSILNTSVYRGLPRDRTLAAPALSAWLQERCAGDAFLRETG